jgi:spore coat protein A
MKHLSRRQLLRRGAGLAATWIGAGRLRKAWAAGPAEPQHGKMKMLHAPRTRPLHAMALPKFVDALPLPPVARSVGTHADPKTGHGVPLYRVEMRQIEARIHRDVKPTRCWSYGDSVPGPTFEVRSGQPIAVEWKNSLPTRHLFAIDHTMCGADAKLPDVRTVVHVHGAKVPPESDGYPDRWFTAGNSRIIHYPNQQDASTLWYHDHAMGIERLNQYAGLFGAYVIRDQAEDALGLPSGPYEIPLFLFDRLFDDDGQLDYPTSGAPDTPWVSEVYGDAILVNGKLTPDLEVERRMYRFRLINASNARIYYLALSGNTPMIQIGSDQGLLPGPVPLPRGLALAPGERADVLIDFSALGGQAVFLMSQALQVMRFRVAPGPAIRGWQAPAVLRQVPRTPRASAVKTRRLSLDEYDEPVHGMLMLLNKSRWRDPVTETAVLDSTEIWEFVNYTEDTHPIHLHLVRFQVLERQHFNIDAFRFEKKMQYLGDPIPPEPGELGWKDTVQAQTEIITRIIVRFEGYVGRYVWHCHVLEHAANEMMRPFEVVPAPRRHA